MEPEEFLTVVPFFAIAAVFYGIYLWKTALGKRLYHRAQDALTMGDRRAALELFKNALWKANEKPVLERTIVRDLEGICREEGVTFKADDYRQLIGQYEQLAKKGSHKALAEIKKVQALKHELISKMPDAA